MKYFFPGLLCLIISLNSSGQIVDEIKKDSVFVSVETSPDFPGGIDSFLRLIMKNVHYPEQARINKEQGRVFVNFIIEKDGSLTNAQVVRHVSESLDAEALRVVNLSTTYKWAPGIQNGQKVRAKFTVPISFKIPAEVLPADSVSKLYVAVEFPPGYPGGLVALFKFLKKNIKYKGRDEGRVRVMFVVEKDGSLSDIKIVSSLSQAADEAVLTVMKMVPKWNPGTQAGQPVRVQYTIPVDLPF